MLFDYYFSMVNQTHRTVYYLSGFSAPVINWKLQGQNGYQSLPCQRVDSGRQAGESLWQAILPTTSVEPIQFYVSGDSKRDPQNRFYEFSTKVVYVQDGQLFSYRPAPSLDAPRRAYDPQRVPQIFSKVLNEYRSIRVYLPRGYKQHTSRRYPVVYFQDGQNVFESGNFGSWNATSTLDRLIARGQMEEVIAVAVDHGSNRYNDFVPPQDGGRADAYARFLAEELKPWLDANYRTLTQSKHQALIGSSLGAVAATYIGWERFHTFGKVAALSGSWWLKQYQQKLLGDRPRPVQFYLDCGDSGPYRDGIHHCQALVDGLMQNHSWSNGQQFLFQVGQGHSHTESAWAFRLKFALLWLFPLKKSNDEALSGSWNTNPIAIPSLGILRPAA